MKIEYLDLIGFEPIHLEKTGGVLSPLLKDINRIGITTYNFYISLMLMTSKQYFESINRIDFYNNLTEDEQLGLNIYDLVILDSGFRGLFEKALNFFILEKVEYNSAFNMFFTYNGMIDEANQLIPYGVIKQDNFDKVRQVILQRNHIQRNQTDIGQIKKKKSLDIYKKILKGREEFNKTKGKKKDSDMELGNLISALASNHNNLNILNIWDITVFQLYDQFERQINKNVFEVQSTAVAFGGSKAAPDFKYTNWYKTIKNSKED